MVPGVSTTPSAGSQLSQLPQLSLSSPLASARPAVAAAAAIVLVTEPGRDLVACTLEPAAVLVPTALSAPSPIVLVGPATAALRSMIAAVAATFAVIAGVEAVVRHRLLSMIARPAEMPALWS